MIEGLGTRLELSSLSCILSIYDHEAECVGMRNKYVCNAVYTDCAIVTKCSNYATKEVRLESVTGSRRSCLSFHWPSAIISDICVSVLVSAISGSYQ